MKKNLQKKAFILNRNKKLNKIIMDKQTVRLVFWMGASSDMQLNITNKIFGKP